MMHDEICTYEVSKLAKDKGFPIECDLFYNRNGKLCNERNYDSFDNEIGCYAPTQSLLQRWLREERGIVVEIIAQPTCSTSKKNCYWWSVKQNSNGFCYQYEECSYLLYSDEGYFDTYELALEDALKYALENLV